MLFEVSHRTMYRYSIPVSFSHHRAHLTPRPCPRQVCRRSVLRITPTPTTHATGVDYFGNPVTYVTLHEQHTELALHARSVIEVRPSACPEPASTLSWDQVFPRLSAGTGDEALDAIQYVFDSPYTAVSSEDAEAYARPSFPPGRPVLEGALDLTRRIFEDFTFDTVATTVSTPLQEVFQHRRGVCQDFAHLQIACLRALRLPARYVSGYLLTRPPEGKERLVGADASHAWIAVYSPGHGWVDLDPTNNLFVSEEHITLGWGRDYGDVSLVTGAIFGGGAHTISVAVDVTPLEKGPAEKGPAEKGPAEKGPAEKGPVEKGK
jgi:transglutaminase-like putative cysteine protease